MRSLFNRLAPAVVLVCAATALAQPANRPAAFTSAINAALTATPNSFFREAKLKSDRGTWIIDVELANTTGTLLTEVDVDATTFVIRKSESETPSTDDLVELNAVIALLNTVAITPAQALATAAGRIADGHVLESMELEIENGALAYKFKTPGPGSSASQRITIAASTGTPTTGGPGSTPPAGSTALTQVIQTTLNAYPGAKILKTEFESDDNIWEVKLVTAQGVARELKLNAAGTSIIKDESSVRGREQEADDRLVNAGLPRAGVTLAQCVQLATTSPGTTAQSAMWVYRKGKLLAKVDVSDSAGTVTKFFDARNGTSADGSDDAPELPLSATLPIDPATAASQVVAAFPGSVITELDVRNEAGRRHYYVKTVTQNPRTVREVIIDGRTGAKLSDTVLPTTRVYDDKVTSVLNVRPTVGTYRNAQRLIQNTLGLGTTGGGAGQIESLECGGTPGNPVLTAVVRLDTKMYTLEVDVRAGTVTPK